MSDAIIVAIISGSVTLLGTVLTVIISMRKTTFDMKTAQAITDTKMDELTREVRLHNNFAQRMPVVEEQIKVINHRLIDLEKGENKL